MAKVKVIIELDCELDLDTYVDPDANDYPYDEQIGDEIVQSLSEFDGIWAELLSDGDVKVTVSE